MKPIRVTNIQHGCVNDGPGVRTVVFLKGCSLHCPWCCNPETISQEQQYFVRESKCLLNTGAASKLCRDCVRKGGVADELYCTFGVKEPVVKDYDEEKIFDELIKDISLYKTSGGGVTFSGGEPLLHIDDVIPIMRRLRNHEVSVAFETSLMVSDESIKKTALYADYWIVDVKLQPEMFLEDDDYCNNMVRRLAIIKTCGSPNVRMVFVDSMLSEVKSISARLKAMGISSLELLQCHNLGKAKYEQMGLKQVDYTADKEKMTQFANLIEEKGIKVKKLYI